MGRRQERRIWKGKRMRMKERGDWTRREKEAEHGWGRDEDQGRKLVYGRAWKERGGGEDR